MGNLELQRQESRPQKIGDGSLKIALQSPKNAVASKEDIQQALRYVMVKIGLRAENWPNEIEREIILEHIRENFGGHSVAEIRLAFDMAISGKIDVDATCYENFSCLYFSKVMNAYRLWAAQEYRESIIEEPLKQDLLTDQQLEDLHRGDIEAFYQRCRSGIVPHRTPEYFKDILVKDGLMGQGEEVSSFFVQRLGKGVEHIYLPND